MGKGKFEVDARILEFVHEIKAHLSIDKIILFGSRARGDALKDSDYDFIVVSSDFEGVFFTDRIKMLYSYWHQPQALEALCYTPAEFKEKLNQITIVREAVHEGIDLTAA
ncbi:MAG: nucleotidyltransferase domain-containing protein [Actinobacteria bacterium]|nr:nucleotidyltransferase domain-containing protein [Actinomycetota bacterium]